MLTSVRKVSAGSLGEFASARKFAGYQPPVPPTATAEARLVLNCCSASSFESCDFLPVPCLRHRTGFNTRDQVRRRPADLFRVVVDPWRSASFVMCVACKGEDFEMNALDLKSGALGVC